jgi:hypothetical protein
MFLPLMRTTRPLRHLLVATAVVAASVSLLAQEPVDLGAVHRIRDEALQNSRVMEHLLYLTDVSGPL